MEPPLAAIIYVWLFSNFILLYILCPSLLIMGTADGKYGLPLRRPCNELNLKLLPEFICVHILV